MKPITPLSGPLTRRDAVRMATIASTGLVIACKTTAIRSRVAGDEPTPTPDAIEPLVGWIQITPENRVKYYMPWTECGQGIGTGMAALIGEELNVDPTEIIVVHAGLNAGLPNTQDYVPDSTGGSASMRSSWDPLRKAAASARELLIATAAEMWQVDPGTLTAFGKMVLPRSALPQNGEPLPECAPNGALPGGGKCATFGALAARAKGRTPPQVQPKTTGFNFIGKPVRRVDIPDKVVGKAVFGIDVVVPNMVNATILHCPVVGGKLGTFDEGAAKRVTGVLAVVPTPFGIACVADTFPHAVAGAHALNPQWVGGRTDLSTDSMRAEQEALLNNLQIGFVGANTGDAPGTLAAAQKKLEQTYEVPYLPHLSLEPQNCTVDLQADHCTIWAPTQDPASARDTAAAIVGLPPEKITINVTLGGGAFGRRLRQDYVSEACHIAMAIKRPVKLLWTRSEEFIRDFYRPASLNRLVGAVDDAGNITAWYHRTTSSSISAWLAESADITPATASRIDGSAIEGAADLPYNVPNMRVDWLQYEPGIPVSWWRSVGYSNNTWVTECFLEELAKLAGKEPLAFRLNLLKDPRLKELLQQAAQASGWGTPLPPGSGRGCAVVKAFGSRVAMVAQVVVEDGNVAVKTITATVDCGTVVNPFLVKTQIQSAVVQALGAAMYWQITVAAGRYVQRSFEGGCPMLTMENTPAVNVILAPSGGPPGGIGEPGVPCVAPAVCNAIFAATGKPVRKLPIAPP